MQSTCRPAAIPAAVIESCLDEPLAVLRTQTTDTTFAKRVSATEVVIVNTTGARMTGWPLEDQPKRQRPRAREQRTRRGASDDEHSSTRGDVAPAIRGSPLG